VVCCWVIRWLNTWQVSEPTSEPWLTLHYDEWMCVPGPWVTCNPWRLPSLEMLAVFQFLYLHISIFYISGIVSLVKHIELQDRQDLPQFSSCPRCWKAGWSLGNADACNERGFGTGSIFGPSWSLINISLVPVDHLSDYCGVHIFICNG